MIRALHTCHAPRLNTLHASELHPCVCVRGVTAVVQLRCIFKLVALQVVLLACTAPCQPHGHVCVTSPGGADLFCYGRQHCQPPSCASVLLQWNQPRATTYSLPFTTSTDLRSGSPKDVDPDTSRHCSWCFNTISAVQNKLSSFAHAELNTPANHDPQAMI
jgi:hypothetical protein